jgi:DtxR family Mn-dependent transcriptional regulator
MTTERWEHYIETIDKVQVEKGYAKVRDVAAILGLGLPTVTEMFQKLSDAGLVNYEKWSGVTLTAEGQRMADELREKHQTLLVFLRMLGVPDDVADTDACSMEHTVSRETLDRLTSFVEFMDSREPGSKWMEHFKAYITSGDVPECLAECLERCPVKRALEDAVRRPPGDG